MATSEIEINFALAEVLDGMRTRWVASAEKLGAFSGSHRHPDVLVTESGVSPVVVENEVFPANTVESDALRRLGETLTDGLTVSAVIAVRTPIRFRDESQAGLRDGLHAAEDLEYALFTGDSQNAFERFPSSGWLVGTAKDLADLIHSAAIPERAVEIAATILQDGVSTTAGLLGQVLDRSQRISDSVADALRQHDSVQTRRIAATIITNAFIFHENLAGSHGIQSVDELRDELRTLTKTAILDEWKKIRDVNYYPIFHIAQQIVTALPQLDAAKICDQAARTAAQLVGAGVTRSHDLAGTVFQKLIADRKFLATFYTRPQAAALLAGLAVPTDAPTPGGDWANPEEVKNFIVADFACGTGTLLSAAYQRIMQLHEGAGGDSEAIHADMIESALVGCDVMPSAVHLTASMLAGTHPSVHFKGDRAYTFPYGKQENGDYALGSLDLLGDTSGMIPLFRTSSPVLAATGIGEEERPPALNLPPGNCDLVIMNPPFTRAGSDWEGAGRTDDNVRPYRGLQTTPEDQRAMAKLARTYGENTCAHGFAGIASWFVAIADRMVRPNGTVALVLPLTVLQGESWQKVRDLFSENYRDITVVTIATEKSEDKSFSADTGMGETLVTARKSQDNEQPGRGYFVTLSRRPQSIVEASAIARSINSIKSSSDMRKLEDGPYGGTPIYVGQEKVGELLNCPINSGEQWPVAGIRDLSLAQVANGLAFGELWLPAQSKGEVVSIPITKIDEIAETGFYHRNINGPSGGFDILRPCPPSATFPTLWNHDAELEQMMIVQPDSEARVRKGREESAARIWATSGHAHHNADLRFNSQPMAVAFTESRTLGGRAWINVVNDDLSHEIVFTLWGNSTLGLLTYWWHASKQQSGRGSIPITALSKLPTLDPRQLDKQQFEAAALLFDDMKFQRMLPFNEADLDPVRQELDRRLLTEVLHLDGALLEPLDLLRRKLCAEPSINGGKLSRSTAN